MTKTLRTPPKDTGAKAKQGKKSSCVKCVQPDNGWMIQCDNRDCGAHHKCVGIKEKEAREIEWYCENCNPKRKQTQICCSICTKQVQDPLASVNCMKCNNVFHTSCLYESVSPGHTDWVCKNCEQELREKLRTPGRDAINRTFHKSQTSVLKMPKMSTNLPPCSLIRQKSTNKSVKSGKSNKSRASMAEIMAINQAKIDNLRKQRELIEQENVILNEQMENLTMASSEEGDSDETQENENEQESLLQRYLTDQMNNSHAPTEEIVTPEHTVQPKKVDWNQWSARQALGRELTIFTGRPEEWPSFMAAYENSTNVCAFTDQENLVRLQKAIKQPARALVESLMYSPKCVPRIIITLKRMFAQPNQLFNSYLERFKKEPNPREDRPESIVVYAASVQNLWAVIHSTHLEDHMSNPFVMDVLIEKLPQSFRYQWDTYQCGKKNDMTTFVEWLDEISDRVCRVNPNMNLVAYNDESSKKGRKSAQIHHHDANEVKIKEKCLACDERCKSLIECQKFVEMSQPERWTLIRDKSVCKQCLKKHPLRPPYKCPSRIKCEEPGCNGLHHKLIHRDRIEPEVTEKNEKNCNHHKGDEKLLFRFVPIQIRFNDKTTDIGAFLDEGSSGTFIDEDVAKKLGANGPKSQLCIHYTSNNSHCEEESIKTSFKIKSNDERAKEYVLKDVQTVKELNLSSQTLNYPTMRDNFEHLKGISVQSYRNLKPQLLIGLNNWRIGVPLEIRTGNAGDPIAARCQLGWSIFAADCKNASQNVHYCNHIDEQHQSNEKLESLVKHYYSLDSLGIQVPRDNVTSREEKRANQMMNKTIKEIDCRYEIGLLWKHDDIKLPDSREMALKRMLCLEARDVETMICAWQFMTK